jgi:hypothetical protein
MNDASNVVRAEATPRRLMAMLIAGTLMAQSGLAVAQEPSELSVPGAPVAEAAPGPGVEVNRDPRDFGGIWESMRFIPVIRDVPMLPETRTLIGGYAAALKSGRILSTAWTSCRPGGISSMVMAMHTVAILHSPTEISLHFEEPRMTRRIRLDGKHPADLAPSYLGDSVGRWEGDTLVVETTGFNGQFEIDAAGLPTSRQLRTVERFTKSADGTRLVRETEITDPEHYSRPFIIRTEFKPADSRHQLEYDCMENPRSEEFKHVLFLDDRYRPVCMAEQGEGMEKSRIVCRKPEDLPSGKPAEPR